MMQELHILQTKVLRELSLHQTRRFSDMMSVTELTSDDFKFHLRKLVKLGLVLKNIDGVKPVWSYSFIILNIYKRLFNSNKLPFSDLGKISGKFLEFLE